MITDTTTHLDAPDEVERHPRDHVDRAERGDREWWRQPPLDRRGWLTVLLAYASMTAVLTLIGLLVVNVWEGSAFGREDADVNRWLEDARTPDRDRLSDIGSMFSDTLTMVVLAAIALPVFLWSFRRWHDWTFLVGALVLEVTTFVTTATLVGRERPPVEQLDSAPTNSFPSGHIAAAVVFYVGLAIIVCWHTRNRLVRLPFLVLAVVAPAAVIASRLYRGMHYPTDAVAGILLGVGALVWMSIALRRSGTRTLSTVN
jgi:membrane-associated phospholipid phosphatase